VIMVAGLGMIVARAGSEGLSREELIELARAQAGRIAEQDRRIAELTARVARLERLLSRNSRNSSMAPSGCRPTRTHRHAEDQLPT
jgi:hypothetical protein